MVADRWYVGVLFGGVSSEHDVSVNSGLNVVEALEARGHTVEPVYLDPSGGWHFSHRPEAPSLERTGTVDTDRARSLAAGSAAESSVLERLGSAGFDALFIALHGPGGEDGVVQGTLRLCGVPFTGSDVLASALAMDKERAKLLLAGVGVPSPDAVTLDGRADEDRLEEAIAAVSLPCVVKPVAGGSSFGTRIVERRTALREAVAEAARHDGRVLLEAFVDGTEVTCGVLGGGVETALALPVTEIEPVGEAFFDFRAKYTVGACNEITPARIREATALEVQRLATLAHEAIGCEGMSRSDFIVGDDGPRYLETNTVPGLTRTSLLPQGAAAAGIEFGELVERIVRSAVRRAEREALTRGT